jgi:hypothetical protein
MNPSSQPAAIGANLSHDRSHRRVKDRLADQWRERIAEQQRGGIRIKQFCKERGVWEYSFYAWRKRLRKRAIDNNATERAIRGVAVGRNNWVFFGSDEGGKTGAILRSFTASCQRAGVDPFRWFQDVLSRIGSRPINRIAELLPHTWAIAQLAVGNSR